MTTRSTALLAGLLMLLPRPGFAWPGMAAKMEPSVMTLEQHASDAPTDPLVEHIQIECRKRTL